VTPSPYDEAPARAEPGGVRRVLVVVAVVATLVGLPLVLAGGALLRRSGVAPSMPNAAALRLVMVEKGFDCDLPEAEIPPAGGAASALACEGDGDVRLRVAAYRNPAAREAAPPAPALADRLARALTGRVT
jgi:hypothetical protein